MILQVMILLLGFVLLVKGADWFVEGAASIARKLGIPQLIVGLTIVAMGTSMPEAAVSITAALNGNAGITIGNVIGSNILNVLLILGITAVITNVAIQKSTLYYEIPFMTAITVVMMIFGKTAASIPFDKRRNGFVTGEGAGIFVLEELEHAKARGAHIYAEIGGYGATCDAHHVTTPLEDGSAAARAMTLAMQDAGVAPEEVDYINAHGTSTKYNDLFETRAIKLAFGDSAYKVHINSTKSMIGHMFAGGGAVELITCVKSINEGYIHPTVGLLEDDPECDLDYTKGEGIHTPVHIAISNSLGFGGHNATVLVKEYQD